MASVTLEVLRWSTSVAYVLVAALAVRSVFAERETSRGWLAAAFVLLALSSAFMRLNGFLGPRHPAAAAPSTLAFAASAVALLGYRGTVKPLPRWAHAAAGLALGVAAMWSLVTRLDPGSPIASSFASLTLLAVWSACVLEATWRFWWAGRRRPPAERARLRLLSGGYAGTVAVVLLLGILGHGRGLPSGSLAIGLQSVAVLLGPVLYASVALPGWLRRWVLRRESRRAAAEANPVGVWYWDAASDLMEYSGKHLVQGYQGGFAGLLERVHPDDRPSVRATMRRCVVDQEPVTLDCRVGGPDGRYRWLSTQARPVVDPVNGRTVAAFGTTIDTTDRRKVEDQATIAQERLAETQRIARIGVWTWNPTTGELYLSEELHRIAGRDPGEELSFEEVVAQAFPEDIGKINAALLGAITRGEPFSLEVRGRRPSGEPRRVIVAGGPVYPADGGSSYLHGIVHDVTDVRRAEQELHRTTQRFERLAERVQDLIYSYRVQDLIYSYRVSAEPGFEYVNPAATAVTGCDPADFYRDPDLVVRRTHPEDRDVVRAVFSDDPPRGPVLTRWTRPDGTLVWLDHRVVPIRGEDGEVEFIEGFAVDATERSTTELALRDELRRSQELNEHLRSVDRMKDTFLGAVSHDLRSPLSSILGLGATIARPDAAFSPEQTRTLAGRIVTNAQRLDHLLGDLLDLERLSRGEVEPQREAVDLRVFAERVVEDIDAEGHAIEVDVPSHVVNVDPVQVERILENLIRNATKHSPPGTRVWVRAESVDQGALLQVCDDGPGVPDEVKTKIFEPFAQAAGARGIGTGVGLSLVQRFAALHGGRAWVEDRPGGGACFKVLLPVEPSSETSPQRAATPAADADVHWSTT